MDYLSIKVERTKRLCQDLQASPGLEPRAFQRHLPTSQLPHQQPHTGRRKETVSLTCNLFYDGFLSAEANHKFTMPLLHNSIEAHVLSATSHRAASQCKRGVAFATPLCTTTTTTSTSTISPEASQLYCLAMRRLSRRANSCHGGRAAGARGFHQRLLPTFRTDISRSTRLLQFHRGSLSRQTYISSNMSGILFNDNLCWR